jgi:hypothetical protein
MATRQWIEMPVAAGDADGHGARPKYPVEASALLVYRGSKVYVSFSGRGDHGTTRRPDVRRLTPAEARAFEESFSFPLPSPPPPAPGARQAGAPLGLGDLVSRLTHRVGIAECGGCRRRRSLLNRLVVWGWWRRPPY